MQSALQGATGSIGACIATTCTYPIEIVRTRIQAGKTDGKSGIFAIFLHILKTEGMKGLFSGLSSQYIQTSLANFLFFYFYSLFRRLAKKMWIKFNQPNKVCIESNEESELEKVHLPSSVNLLVGIAAAIAQVLLITPINVSLTRIKTNSPPASPNNRNLLTILLQILKSEGFSKLYAGIGPALILTVNPGIEFTIIESLADFYKDKTNQKRLGGLATFIISAIGKIGATLVTYPYILSKVRMQNSGETNLFVLVSKMISESGILGLYAGIQIQLIKSVMFACVRNLVKEKINSLM